MGWPNWSSSVYFLCSVAQSCVTLCDPMDCSLPGSSVQGILQAKNTGVGCHFLLQGIFSTQGLNPHLNMLFYWMIQFSETTHIPRSWDVVIQQTKLFMAKMEKLYLSHQAASPCQIPLYFMTQMTQNFLKVHSWR